MRGISTKMYKPLTCNFSAQTMLITHKNARKPPCFEKAQLFGGVTKWKRPFNWEN